MAHNRFTPPPFPAPPPAETNPYPTSAAAPSSNPDDFGLEEDLGLDGDTAVQRGYNALSDPNDPAQQRKLAALQGLSRTADPQKMMPTQPFTPVARSSKLPWFLLAIVTIGGGVYLATRSAEQAPPTVGAKLDTTPKQPERYGDLVASGYIAAKAPIILAATSGARLTEVRVDTGDRVEKGQVVAVIDAGSLRAELGLANARYNAAKRGEKRVRTLVNAQAATQSDLEAAVSAVQIEGAQVGVIRQKLNETQIRSPLTGTVLEVLARPGEALKAAAGESPGVLRIADLTSLVAESDISEADLKNIELGQPAEVTTDAQRGVIYKGTVREISEQADKSRGTVLVKVYIEPNKDSVLKPGMAVQVRFTKAKDVAPGSVDSPDGTAPPKAIEGATTQDPAPTTAPSTEPPAAVVPSVEPAKPAAPVVKKATKKTPPKRKRKPPPKRTGSSLPDL